MSENKKKICILSFTCSICCSVFVICMYHESSAPYYTVSCATCGILFDWVYWVCEGRNRLEKESLTISLSHKNGFGPLLWSSSSQTHSGCKGKNLRFARSCKNHFFFSLSLSPVPPFFLSFLFFSVVSKHVYCHKDPAPVLHSYAVQFTRLDCLFIDRARLRVLFQRTDRWRHASGFPRVPRLSRVSARVT